ncbi:unnamed protein product, partial [marine sediment metagenome]
MDTYRPARFTAGRSFVKDSAGKRVRFDDPRLTHIYPFPFSPHLRELLAAVYRKWKLNMRVCGTPGDMDTLQLGRRLCSGRE